MQEFSRLTRPWWISCLPSCHSPGSYIFIRHAPRRHVQRWVVLARTLKLNHWLRSFGSLAFAWSLWPQFLVIRERLVRQKEVGFTRLVSTGECLVMNDGNDSVTDTDDNDNGNSKSLGDMIIITLYKTQLQQQQNRCHFTDCVFQFILIGHQIRNANTHSLLEWPSYRHFTPTPRVTKSRHHSP